MRRRILTIVFSVLSLGLAYYLYYSIRSEVEDGQEIARIEGLIIDKLKVIRSAEKAYLSVYGTYADNWDSLANFILNGSLYLTQRSEKVYVLDYGADSVQVVIDTLGVVSVRDSLFSANRFASYDFNALGYAPHVENKEFLLYTGEVKRGGILVDVIEVVDPVPINPNRSSDNTLRGFKPLHFGSRNSVSLAGNWE